jgi:hypothetical protein
MDPQAAHFPNVRSRAPLAPGLSPSRCSHGTVAFALLSCSSPTPPLTLARSPLVSVSSWALALRPGLARSEDDRQPRFHGPGADQRSPAAPLASRGLYPNPIRSGTSCREIAAHRLETPMSPGATCQRSSRITAVHDHAARPDPREGSRSCAPDGPLARGHRAGESQGPIRHGWRERHPGPRAVSPVLPRRRAGSTAPEVPSIDEPARPQPISRSLSAGGPRSACGAILSRGLKLSTGCHQPGDNTCAFGDPVRSATLDGAAWTMNG